jgi:hypothetical protein
LQLGTQMCLGRKGDVFVATIGTIIHCYWKDCDNKKDDGTCGLREMDLGKKPGTSPNTTGCQNFKFNAQKFKAGLTEKVQKEREAPMNGK